jgi:ribosomal protein S27AE
MAEQKLKDCPERPPCPKCGTAMFTIDHIDDGQDYEHCEFECLRCGHIEVSETAKVGNGDRVQ